jgi:hypothetical protein
METVGNGNIYLEGEAAQTYFRNLEDQLGHPAPGDKNKEQQDSNGGIEDPENIAGKQRAKKPGEAFGKTPGESVRNWRFWYDWVFLEVA